MFSILMEMKILSFFVVSGLGGYFSRCVVSCRCLCVVTGSDVAEGDGRESWQ